MMRGESLSTVKINDNVMMTTHILATHYTVYTFLCQNCHTSTEWAKKTYCF